MAKPDPALAAKIAKIKDMKPMVPGGFNSFDFTLGDSGKGVRVILTCEDDQWCLSTSIGTITPGKYTPMPLDEWTVPLRVCATDCVKEILEHFDIDPASRRADSHASKVIVTFRFREIDDE